jgi:hypothetical protein
METIYLKNIHFVYFDNWFIGLSEKEQDDLISNYGGLEKYLGINLISTKYDEEKGFEFEIVDKDRWNQKNIQHEFLNYTE